MTQEAEKKRGGITMPEGIKELVYPILKEELIPALGCTEPIAIAYACAKAKEVLGAFPEKMTVRCSGNIVKNVKGVVVPNTVNLKGIKTAALMGVVCGDASKGLQVIAGSTAQDVARVKELLKSDLCKVELIEGEENLQIWAVLEQTENQVQLQIKREHTNITKIIKNGEVLLDKDDCSSQPVSAIDRSRLTVESIVAYVENEDLSEIRPLLEKQVECNMAIAEEGLKNPFGSQVGRIMMKNNPDDLFTKVIAYAASGSDARMSGCNLPGVVNFGLNSYDLLGPGCRVRPGKRHQRGKNVPGAGLKQSDYGAFKDRDRPAVGLLRRRQRGVRRVQCDHLAGRRQSASD